MTSFRQFEANRRNALRSTGPKTDDGKRRSRGNALRHGLTAETLVRSLEDAEDYKAFEAAITSDYCAETAVERELVLRLASLLWRLRRATAIETDLFQIQAESSKERRTGFTPPPGPAHWSQRDLHRILKVGGAPVQTEHSKNGFGSDYSANAAAEESGQVNPVPIDLVDSTRHLTYCFLRLANLESGVFERLGRYEAALWRQTLQTLFALHPRRRRSLR
jgi:hypothetical protein